MDSLTDPQFFTAGVSPFGNPRINAYFQFPVAYRRLSRPSSALGAKAFTLCSFSLEQSFACSLSLLELRLQLIVIGFFFNFAVEKAFYFHHSRGKIVVPT